MNWTEIDHHQFEDIACLYAQNMYKDFSWVPTQKTNDGNKDGEFVEYIKSIDFLYKGWFEAKYTENVKKSIPKSHLDSTLVSGILDGSVVYILFITNGKITQNFRRRAKAILTPYRINVDFIEGKILEEWLKENGTIYDQYFSDEVITGQLPQKKLKIDDICFFNAIYTPSTLINPITTLIVQTEYLFYVSINSNYRTSLKLKLIQDVIVISPGKDNPEYLNINPGYNSFYFKCIAKSSFQGDIHIQLAEGDGKQFIVKSKKHRIKIENNFEPMIIFNQQTRIIHEIFNQIKFYSNDLTLFQITGSAGYGKSHLLRKLHKSIFSLHSQSLTLTFSEKNSENACSLCKLILFISFGYLYTLSDEAYTEIIKDSIILPFEIYHELRKGTNNQIKATRVIGKIAELLLEKEYSLLSTQTFSYMEPSYIIIDDFHKISGIYADILIEILKEYQEKVENKLIIIGNRANEFKSFELDMFIRKFNKKSWELNQLTITDIDDSILKNFDSNVHEIAKMFPQPLNALHLTLLMKRLTEKNIINLTAENQLISFENCYNESNIQNSQFVIEKLKKCTHFDLLYLIYKLENGVSFDLLKEYIGSESIYKIANMIQGNLLKLENGYLSPYHDVYLYAFYDLDIDDRYIKKLNKFLSWVLSRNSIYEELESNILATLLKSPYIYNLKIKNSIRKAYKRFYELSDYQSCIMIGNHLYDNNKSVEKYTYEDLETLYIYAMSIKYSESHYLSTSYLIKICEVGNFFAMEETYQSYLIEAYSELLNNAIWSLNSEKALSYINQLKNMFHKKVTISDSVHKINGYLNLLNRTMLYTALFNNCKDIETVYNEALIESKRLERTDYSGYALMDYAKNIMIFDFKLALDLLEKAYLIFSSNPSLKKRAYDCKSEMIFLSSCLYNIPINELYEIQRNTLNNGLLHAYAKATLKILAIELVNNCNINDVENKLKKLFIQYPDMKRAHKLNALAQHIWSAIYYLKGDSAKQKYHSLKYKKLIKNKSDNYLIIANHNELVVSGDNLVWYQENQENRLDKFWIDPRLW